MWCGDTARRNMLKSCEQEPAQSCKGAESFFFSFLELGAIIVVFQLGNFLLLAKRKWRFVGKEENEWKRR